MAEILETIARRQSVRTFSDKPVGEEMVQVLLHAAQCAPSAGNQKPWHFVVLQDRQVITRIPEFHPYSAVLLKCTLAIALFANPEEELFPGNWPLDCAAATENILLQAEALHLGAVWLGIYPEEERMQNLEALLEVPRNYRAFSVVAVGHPAEKPRFPERIFDSSRIHYDRW
ncbi:MAG TPA: nitroreductase family protein [Synergistaceae bacterium]|nr:nitroreductase family protein [Synergistaceae bacterium]HPQ37752.1 nitroreductase family protein [Synergistaceae bacterium]